jgi:hypothetical protein
MSTIHTATKRLSPNLKVAIKRCWKAAKIHDLNYGSAADYLNVIAQHFERQNEEIKALESQLSRIHRESRLNL